MKIPSNWNSIFEKTFYDKQVDVLSRHDTYDSEGGLITNIDSGILSTFFGNVRFDNLKAIQENYGLKEKIDLIITAPTNTSLDLNNLVRYESKEYLITDVIPFDSHLMVACKIWK